MFKKILLLLLVIIANHSYGYEITVFNDKFNISNIYDFKNVFISAKFQPLDNIIMKFQDVECPFNLKIGTFNVNNNFLKDVRYTNPESQFEYFEKKSQYNNRIDFFIRKLLRVDNDNYLVEYNGKSYIYKFFYNKPFNTSFLVNNSDLSLINISYNKGFRNILIPVEKYSSEISILSNNLSLIFFSDKPIKNFNPNNYIRPYQSIYNSKIFNIDSDVTFKFNRIPEYFIDNPNNCNFKKLISSSNEIKYTKSYDEYLNLIANLNDFAWIKLNILGFDGINFINNNNISDKGNLNYRILFN